ncbi:hypothetical protein Acr_17g0001700 [Actinidia rufa]|uniref:Uncharacterized protein n=1 Tax=Actinidia rufa TaxID=165716 RepID=A0A7J0G1D9_9ERIC|nr:hypothetical protein Acr_17g0001700 [Actinidia rufa]
MDADEELQVYVVLQVVMQEFYLVLSMYYAVLQFLFSNNNSNYGLRIRALMASKNSMTTSPGGLGNSEIVTLEEKVALFLNILACDWKVSSKTVEVESDSVWEAYVMISMPRACGTSISLTMSLDYTFGKNRATGELAEGPAHAVENIDLEEVDIFGDDGLMGSANVGDMDHSNSVTLLDRNPLKILQRRKTRQGNGLGMIY